MKENLNDRVTRLERENQRLKRGGLAAFMVLGGALLMGQVATERTPEAVEAHSFQVVDKEGQIRAEMSMLPDGSPFLSLLDKSGTPRVTQRVLSNGTLGLNLTDNEGKTRAALVVFSDGNPSLNLFNKEGKVVWKTE